MGRVVDEGVHALVELVRGKRVVALTGAGCSTESGIPDYRGPRMEGGGFPPTAGMNTPPRTRAPMQHREFVDRPEARRRYWARSLLGWPQLAAAQPNPAHRALAGLEEVGVVTGVITQNVDSLHGAAGSREVVELHGALARVQCLTCRAISPRTVLQDRLLAANPTWPARARAAALAPDGDVDLPDELVAQFAVVTCDCGGVLMPDVVFFGGSVPKDTLAAAWTAFDRAELLLVVGSSLAVFSGFRFVRRAAERGVPVAIVNRGPTRGDELAALRIDARAGELLPALLDELHRDRRVSAHTS